MKWSAIALTALFILSITAAVARAECRGIGDFAHTYPAKELQGDATRLESSGAAQAEKVVGPESVELTTTDTGRETLSEPALKSKSKGDFRLLIDNERWND